MRSRLSVPPESVAARRVSGGATVTSSAVTNSAVTNGARHPAMNAAISADGARGGSGGLFVSARNPSRDTQGWGGGSGQFAGVPDPPRVLVAPAEPAVWPRTVEPAAAPAFAVAALTVTAIAVVGLAVVGLAVVGLAVVGPAVGLWVVFAAGAPLLARLARLARRRRAGVANANVLGLSWVWIATPRSHNVTSALKIAPDERPVRCPSCVGV
jgi:hypothetical protein